ncbi:MAG: permease [Planctomycetes bacterium]|nr:permease [Planctomycetota bacterium]
MAAVFLAAYFLPLSKPQVRGAVVEAFRLLQWYARNHTLACVVPALFIAGGIITFLSQASVMRYLGPNSNKLVAYGVASVSGAVLAVCSCSVLPMFAGIYQLGAGLGPATAFLYSGPAINVLAIFLTARVLGLPIGAGRAMGAVAFALVIGLLMASFFRRGERKKASAALQMPEPEKPRRPLWKVALYFFCMIAFLVFSDWYNPGDVVVHMKDGQQFSAVELQEMKDDIVFQLKEGWAGHDADEKVSVLKRSIAHVDEAKTWVIAVHNVKWYLAGAMGLAVLLMAWRWFDRDELRQWMRNTWSFAKLLVPLLFGGVFIVGFIGPLLPEKYVAGLVGDNSLQSNLVASVIGSVWYFATLTEIPICQALGKLGMHHGPMLALLLAGPALSLPNMLVIYKVMGGRKTLVFCLLVVVMSTAVGMAFGTVWG